VPAARPGSRAPHLWLGRDGEQISALDLFDTSFVLLVGEKGQAWRTAGEHVAQQLGVPLRCYSIGRKGNLIDQRDEWPSLYGVGANGAVLVRPDGIVAWRTEAALNDPSSELISVLRRILSPEGQSVNR
jgi:hypothetical protein